ncbi:hypothetical protein PIB30_081565 [Stylosanthes scabra]|uniref:Uncharacterized protein n=1 Tax=Stylosanthes scabra TaxID=79078 RepID=A0ABU6RRK4_9FABA|nr:hypothetical protein [Stylosanthes scabra]
MRDTQGIPKAGAYNQRRSTNGGRVGGKASPSAVSGEVGWGNGRVRDFEKRVTILVHTFELTHFKMSHVMTSLDSHILPTTIHHNYATRDLSWRNYDELWWALIDKQRDDM